MAKCVFKFYKFLSPSKLVEMDLLSCQYRYISVMLYYGPVLNATSIPWSRSTGNIPELLITSILRHKNKNRWRGGSPVEIMFIVLCSDISLILQTHEISPHGIPHSPVVVIISGNLAISVHQYQFMIIWNSRCAKVWSLTYVYSALCTIKHVKLKNISNGKSGLNTSNITNIQETHAIL